MIRFCPKCGRDSFSQSGIKDYKCSECNFRYFHNSASAVTGLLRHKEKVLFLTRAENPGKGLLDLPGGFVDYDESMENALRREVNEELGLDFMEGLRYLFSYPNSYEFENVLYKTTDAFFEVELQEEPEIAFNDEVLGTKWMDLSEVDVDKVAFESTKMAITILRNRGFFAVI